MAYLFHEDVKFRPLLSLKPAKEYTGEIDN